MDRGNVATIQDGSRAEPIPDRHARGGVARDGVPGRKGRAATAGPLVAGAHTLGAAALLGWLILVQFVRWADPWSGALTWCVFGLVLLGWVQRKHMRAVFAALGRSPLWAVVLVAAWSAWVNGAGWDRVADWTLYAIMFAYFLDRRPDYGRALLWVGWALIALCLVDWVYLHGYASRPGRVGLGLNANVIAACLAVALPQGSRHAQGRARLVWWVLGIAALAGTGSRAGLLGLGLYGAVLLYQRCMLRARWVLVGGALLLAVLAAARMRTTSTRIDAYGGALGMFQDRPLLGSGPGRFVYDIARSPVLVGSSLVPGFSRLFHAHNLILSVLAEMGIAGLGALGLALLWALRGDWQACAPLAFLAPFWIVDDMTMYWFVSLGLLYVASTAVEVSTVVEIKSVKHHKKSIACR